MLGRKFKAPAADDVKQWKKVQFLYEHGFWFESIYDDRSNVSYPKTLSDAKVFVKKYLPQPRVDEHGRHTYLRASTNRKAKRTVHTADHRT
jgi:hypothetical protein